MAKKSLPKTIFVKWEEASANLDPWLSASTLAESLLDVEGPAQVGEYKLVGVRKGSLKPTFEK